MYELTDVACSNLLGTKDDDGVCTTVPDPCLSLVTSSSRQFSRVCIVTESRASTASTAVNPATKCWPQMGNITKSWSMVDEWSAEVTLALEHLLTEVSKVQRCSPCVWCIPIARVLLNGFSRVSVLLRVGHL